MTNAAGGPPKKGMSGCMLGIVALVVLAIIIGCCGGGGWFVYHLYHQAKSAVVTVRENLKNGPSLPGVTLDGVLPASFPKDIPVFDGLKPVEGVSTPDGGGQETFEGKADVNEVIAFYRQEMGKAGWEDHGGMAQGEGTLMNFTKDNRTATITVTGGSGRDVTVLMYYGKQEGASPEIINPGGENLKQPEETTKRPQDGGVTAERPTVPAGEQPGGETGNGGSGGTEQLRSVNLPGTYPKDVPVYPGMTVTFGMDNPPEGKGSIIAEGKADRAAVVAFYKKKLADGGWKEESEKEVSVADLTLLQYSSGKRSVSVEISPGVNGLSAVTIEYNTVK